MFFKYGLFWSLNGAKTEHRGCFGTTEAISAPMFSALFAKSKGQIETIANLIEKTCYVLIQCNSPLQLTELSLSLGVLNYFF